MRLCAFQAKYKEAGKKEASSSLYHLLPETLDTQHAKEAYQLQSEVRDMHTHTHTHTNVLTHTHTPLTPPVSLSQTKYKEVVKKENSTPLYALLPDTAEIQLAREQTDLQSQVQQQPTQTTFLLLSSSFDPWRVSISLCRRRF